VRHLGPLLLLVAAASACGGHPLGSSTGAAGSPPATPTGGAVGTGAGGGGGTPAPSPKLPISGSAALERAAAVLWQAPSDGPLADQAAAGAFATKDQFGGAVRGLLADPRARVGVSAFYRWWLGLDRLATPALDKDATVFPEYTPELRADMALEPQTFGSEMTLSMKGSFTTLMTAGFGWVTPDVATLYGVHVATGSGPLFVNFAPGERAGLLTQPALQALGSLATRNSPSRRGTEVMSRFFCLLVPTAPPDMPSLDPIPPGTSVRAALSMSRESAACQACHFAFDNLGLPFEAFDAIGRARATDNGVPVDPTVSFVLELEHGGSQVAVYGPADLATKMAADSGVQGCFAQRWLEFALGHAVQDPGDSALAKIVAEFSSSGFDLQALIVAVFTSDAFLAP
jgi:hypothetical protein